MRTATYALKTTVAAFVLILLTAEFPARAEMIVSDRTMQDMQQSEAAALAQWKKEAANAGYRFKGGGTYIDVNGEVWKYNVTQPAKIEPGVKYPLFIGNTGWALAASESQAQYRCYVMNVFIPQSVFVGTPKGFKADPDYKSVVAAITKACIDKMTAENPGVDTSRVYIEGASKWGAHAWLSAFYYPDTYAAIVPSVGGGDLSKTLEVARRKIGICMYYGILDGGEPDFTAKPYGRTAPYIFKTLTAAGFDPLYIKYTQGNHHEYGFSDSTRNPQWNDFTRLRKWLFAQKKPTTDWPVITSPTVLAAPLGKPFAYTIAATNKPVSFTAVVIIEHAESNTGEVEKPGSDMPKGLSFDAKTGVVSGTPAEAGRYFIRMSAGNDKGAGITTLFLTVK